MTRRAPPERALRKLLRLRSARRGPRRSPSSPVPARVPAAHTGRSAPPTGGRTSLFLPWTPSSLCPVSLPPWTAALRAELPRISGGVRGSETCDWWTPGTALPSRCPLGTGQDSACRSRKPGWGGAAIVIVPLDFKPLTAERSSGIPQRRGRAHRRAGAQGFLGRPLLRAQHGTQSHGAPSSVPGVGRGGRGCRPAPRSPWCPSFPLVSGCPSGQIPVAAPLPSPPLPRRLCLQTRVYWKPGSVLQGQVYKAHAHPRPQPEEMPVSFPDLVAVYLERQVAPPPNALELNSEFSRLGASGRSCGR